MPELLAELAKTGKNLGFTDEKKVTKDWLLLMLSTVAPGHRFFKADYYPKHHPRANVSWGGTSLIGEVPGFRS